MSERAKRIVSVAAVLLTFGFAGFLVAAYHQWRGWETRTTSPTTNQVTHARQWLFINPSLEIEPLADYIKTGMDYQVRFKFIAATDDPSLVFDSNVIDASAFLSEIQFPLGESSHNEPWWDVSSKPLSGGRFLIPEGVRYIHIGYHGNDNDTLTVYVWRHE